MASVKSQIVIGISGSNTTDLPVISGLIIDGTARTITPKASGAVAANWEYDVGANDQATAYNLRDMLLANSANYDVAANSVSGGYEVQIDAKQYGDSWDFGAPSISPSDKWLSIVSQRDSFADDFYVTANVVGGNACDNLWDVELRIEGGVPPYVAYWSDGGISYHSDQNVPGEGRNGLPADTYDVRIVDSVNNETDYSFYVGEKPAITIDGTITYNNLGTRAVIRTQINGRYPPYTYSWADGPTTKDRLWVPPGRYVLTVSDSNGCTRTKTFLVHAFTGFVALKLNGEFLELDQDTAVDIDVRNPALEPGKIYGSKIVNISLPITPTNQRLLGFAEVPANTQPANEWQDVECYLHKLLWRVGTLKLRRVSGVYEMSFYSDNGDVQARLKNRTMPGLDLGTDTPDYQTSQVYPNVNHIFFPIKNVDFYGNKNTDYKGYVNYYYGGSFATNGATNDYTRVPFPFLLYILDKTYKELGYRGIQGDWTTDAEIRKVVIYNNYAIDKLDGSGKNVFDTTITYNRHVPEIGIGDFLIDVAVFFGVVPMPDPKTGWVDIVRIGDLLTASYKDVLKPGIAYEFVPNQADGYYFAQMRDDSDKLLEADSDWLTYKVGQGGERVETRASTLLVESDDDTINTRTWTIPVVQQPGSSPEFDLGLNRAPLRFLVYNGLQTDSAGNSYPQGHYATPAMSLRWDDGSIGLSKNYDEWMAWRDKTIKVERELRMTIGDFLARDITDVVMVDRLRYILGRLRAQVRIKDGIGPVRAELWKL